MQACIQIIARGKFSYTKHAFLQHVCGIHPMHTGLKLQVFPNFVPFNIGKCMIKTKYIPKDSNI